MDDLQWIRDGLKKPGKTQKGLAEALGVDASQVTRLLKGDRQLKAAELPRIADYLDEPAPWPRDRPVAAAGRRQHAAPGEPDLQILGNARGGSDGFFLDNGTVQGFTARPLDLVGIPEAYAVYMVGDSMTPAIRHGWLCYVNPLKPPAPGDDVVVQLADGQGFIKELVRRTAKAVICKEYHPEAREIAYAREQVASVHLVVSSTRVRG
jgi:phage repressor protein C with HTH and peptisase S24 domain